MSKRTATPLRKVRDYALAFHGSDVLIRPLVPEVLAQLKSIVDPAAIWWCGALVCEPRYVTAITDALDRGEGCGVTINGEEH